MSAPLVSFVMPVRNGARWIGEAIESALGQTMKEIELVVVDDGSTDDTASVVAGYQGRDARVKLLQRDGRGAAAARNTGRENAAGRWIASLDADDVAEPDRLEAQLLLAERGDLV